MQTAEILSARKPQAAGNAVDAWFAREVLPLEAALLRYLRRNWRETSELEDLRQEVYVRVYDAARKGAPKFAKAFLFSTARNLLIDRAKRAKIVVFEPVADIDALNIGADVLTPDRHCAAMDELRRLQLALDLLPPRCREVVILRKLHDMPQREVAARLGITEDTVERQVLIGVRRLAQSMFNDEVVETPPVSRAG